MTDQTAKDIGEIKGLLEGVTRMIDAHQQSMNRRIDDMHASNTRRLDDIASAVHSRLDGQQARLDEVKAVADKAHAMALQHEEALDGLRKQAVKSGSLSGIGAGTLVSVGIELIKQALKAP